MNFKQQVILQQLRIGDRFSYLKSSEVWQVTNQTPSYTHVNKFYPDGKPYFKYDILKKNTIKAVFLRHTRPLPGEICKLGDLAVGDRFFTRDNVVIEYTVQPKPSGLFIFQVLVVTDAGDNKVMSTDESVFYVGNKKAEVV